MPDAEIEVAGRSEPIAVRINGPNANFILASDAIRASARSELDDRSLDFLEIAATVFAADSGVRRGPETRPNMGRKWRRDFTFRIPVRRPDLWRRPDVLEALVETTEFLTDDHVEFEFLQAETVTPLEPYFSFDADRESFRADEVILFSGGLDSYAGALGTLCNSDRNVVLVTHRSAQKTMPRQVALGKELKRRFPNRVLHLHIQARRQNQSANDQTQRSRTLLFAAMAQAVARTFGARRLSFFENGIVSHNLPLSQQIVGTMATRTTHPRALSNLNRLFDLVWPEGARIENRYRWFTKTDVLRRVAENDGARLIPLAVSCTSVREQTGLHTHCGACSQCLDRRFGILAAGLEDFDKPEDYKTDVLYGPRDTTRSRTMALEWTRHALRLGNLDSVSAMSEFGLELSRIISGHPDLAASDALSRTVQMHRRHSEAVRSILKRVTAHCTADIIEHALPATSLLVMHLGQTPSGAALAGSALYKLRFAALADETIPDHIGEMDSDHVAGSALRVAFFREGRHFVIAAAGLGRVVGVPAMVAHGLKPAFDEDRAEGHAPGDHRFLRPPDIPHCGTMSKAAVRAAVARCRSQLAEFYEAVRGAPPDTPLLIENVQGMGYRLDPVTIPVHPRHLKADT